MIDPKGSQISFHIDVEIEISKEGSLSKETEITFNQPVRKVAAKFETLVSLYKQSMMKASVLYKQLFPEQAEQQMLIAQDKKGVAVEDENSEKSLEELTQEDIENEVESSIEMLSGMEYNFEKAYNIFEKIILHPGICKIGGKQFTEVHLDKVNYRDFKKMMLTYVIFFQKPLRRNTGKGSESRSDSDTEVKEL